MSNGRRPEWAHDRRWQPVGRGVRQPTTLDALLAGLDADPAERDLPATALVWLGVDPDARARRGSDFDDGHRAWLDRAEFWSEFRNALSTVTRLDDDVGRRAMPGAFAARPQSDTPIPTALLGDQDSWQQELAELIRRERMASLMAGAPGASRYLSLYDAVAAGVLRMAAAGLEPTGEAAVCRATLLAAHPHEPVDIALDTERLLSWRLRWATDPERERALLHAEAIARRTSAVHDLLRDLATSAIAWVALPAAG